MWKKRLRIAGGILLGLVLLFVLFVGPWPTYGSTDITQKRFYKKAVAAIDTNALESAVTERPKHLWAGWAKRSITPPIGTPLAGFGDREGKPSTGSHDPLFVKALALFDGDDTVVLVGADMVVIPEKLAELVRKKVADRVPLTANDILFSATHTHSGPGAMTPGYAGKIFSGKYDKTVMRNTAQAFTDAIVEAYDNREAAALGYGSVQVPDLIHNRARDEAVDALLGYIVAERSQGDRCYVVRYSAHATILGGSNMEFSGDYPGYVQRAIEEETGDFAMYLGGALGSMSASTPEGDDAFARAEAMGKALAKRVLESTADLALNKEQEIASVGIPLSLPSLQLRLNNSWRVSPVMLGNLGVDSDGWLQGIRIGNLFLAGTPADFSGELGVQLTDWAAEQKRDLWVTSFNGDYVGYISPDEYYDTTDPEGMGSYEIYMMNWCGPNQGALFTGLIQHMTSTLAEMPTG